LAAAMTWMVPTLLKVRASRSPASPPVPQTVNIVLDQVATLPFVIGAVMVLAGTSNGLYALAAGILVSFVVAVVNAWVLLIEILR
jgi:hypothetical protein